MTLNGGRRETMALVTIAPPCPPPLEPLSPLTSAPSIHNSESEWGWVGGWVGTGWTLPTAKARSACLTARGQSCWVLAWLLESERAARQIQTLLLVVLWRVKGKNSQKCYPFFPSLSYFGGSVSTSGIHQDLPRWVQACLCSPEIALHNLRNVDERCLACPWWVREMDSVCYKWYTDTHTCNPLPPLSSVPDDPHVSMIWSRGTVILSWSPALY